MKAIVSVCADWGIGYKGQLLVPNREDMQRFARLTCGGRSPATAADGEVLGCVVMGRKTAESFPGARPLKARRNIVLTRDRDWASRSAQGFECAHDRTELEALLATEDPENTWLIGGEAVYRLLLDACSQVLVTRNECIRQADVFFPNLDEDPTWTLTQREDGGLSDEGIPFSYLSYSRQEQD